MKNYMIGVCLMVSLNSFASIDVESSLKTEATQSEISASRACFKQLEVLGCGHPREELDRFRICLSNSYGALTPACKTMMQQLYGK